MANGRPGKVAVAIDLRCLQDASYARRGVGRHVMALLQTAPADAVELIGIVDERLQPLLPEAATLMAHVVPNAYAAHKRLSAATRPAAFISASPMTHDATYTGRLVHAPGVLHAALVYDFIPLDYPERYLTTGSARIGYANQMAWLAPADLFATNSRSTADDLIRILGVQPERVFVVGSPMAYDFAPLRPPGDRGRIVVVGGADARKSPETVIVAHARSKALQAAGVILAIGGNYPEADAAAFANLAGQNGGDPKLLHVPGYVDDVALGALYGDARIMVCPSVAEGFSMPVVEGMAAGAVVLATDIPAHAELVTDPANLFPVGDADALTALLESWWHRAADATDLIARQSAVAERFRAPAIGARFWPRLLRAAQAVPRPFTVGAKARPAVAFMTPLPPDCSGVADYTFRTCTEMAAFADVHCYTPTRRPKPMPGVTSVQPLSALPALLPAYDAVVAVVGNSHFHTQIVQHALEYGAAVIAHDARMLGFYRILLGLDRALDVAARELRRPVSPHEMDDWLSDERRLKALFLGELARAASPMVVHSPVTAAAVKERYGIDPAYLPFSIYRHWSAEELSPARREAARNRLDLPPGEVVLATFGLLAKDKAPEECIWALSILRDWNIPARLVFAGDAAGLDDHGEALRSLAARLGVAPYVSLRSGYLPEATYKDLLVAADIGIQLRTYGLGGLSGAVLDCAAAGLPTVVNQSLFDVVQPPGYTRAIPDSLSSLLLAEAVASLLQEIGDRRSIEHEREAFNETRGMRSYARRLCGALDLPVH